ncbi:TonB-dependent siderophore receptor [Halomonas sp. AOP35-4E-18]|uniref:TonB-dependent siderophore receptor n=1 Tax=Halomonas sp. AOP35-4E-18 TaxID=3457686 RepID=UPI004033F290
MTKTQIKRPGDASINMGRECSRLLVVSSALLLSSLAVAENDDIPSVVGDQSHVQTLPAIQVQGTMQSGPQSLKGATLSKMALDNREIAQSVSVIDRERIEQQSLADLDDVMQQATGVTVQPFQNLTTQYYVRGFQADSFELDGVPAGIGDQASSPQDMAIYERVEILRGANGLLHGSGNPAATVNLVRKKPTRTPQSSINLSAGSWARYRGEFDTSGPLNNEGTLRGRFVTAYENRDFFYDVADQQTGLLYAILEADLSDDTVLSFGAQYQDIDSTTSMAGVPMAADGSDLHLSRSTYMDVDWDQFDWTTRRLFGSLDHQLGGGWTSKLSLEYENSDSQLKYAGVYGSAIDPATGNGAVLMPGAYRFHSDYRSADAHASGPFELFGGDHEALVGLSYHRRDHQMETGTFESNIMQPVNIYTWDPSSVPEPSVVRYDISNDSQITEKGLYAMGRFSLTDPLTLVFGSRLSWWDQDTLTSSYNPDQQLTPYGGVIWDFSDDWSAYVSYSGVFQPQTELTYDRRILEPIEGDSYETGIKGALYENRLNVSAAIFRIDQTKRAVEDPEHPGIGQSTYYVNGGEVRSQGVELEVNGELTPRWDIYAGYTYTDTEYLRDPDNQGEVFSSITPSHLLKAWTNYTLPWQEDRWSVGAGVYVQSEYTRTSNAIELRQSGYTTANMRVGYRINPAWTAALNVNNLFDKSYYQELFSPSWNNRYGEPRSVTVSIRGAF